MTVRSGDTEGFDATLHDEETATFRNDPQAPTSTGLQGSRSNHPFAAFFHVFFRVASFLTYLFCTLFSDNFIIMFVVCVVIMAVDFWVVKNVTGRLLVGLRWWNEIKEDGSSEWRFESKPQRTNISPVDSRIFWVALYLTPIVWAVMAFSSLIQFNFSWLLVVVVALVLSSANLIGYTKCEKDAKKKLKEFAVGSILQNFTGAS